MSKVKGNFMDSDNIIIINDIPHFYYSGKSYLERLKNGLSFDYVFMMEDTAISYECVLENEDKTEKKTSCFQHKFLEEDDYDYDKMTFSNRKNRKINKGKKKYILSMPTKCKCKCSIKRRSSRNMKKNKIKQTGYDDKLHVIEVNLPTICEENEIGDNEDLDDYSSGYWIWWGSEGYDSLDEWNEWNNYDPF